MVLDSNKNFIVCILCCLFLLGMITVAEAGPEDMSVALLWKGKLIWTTHSFGRLCGYPAWTCFDWPMRMHDPRSQHIVTGSFIFATEDNVIESYATPTNPDWMPKDRSLGYYHSGEGLLVNLIFPQMASSDLPETWPRRSRSDPSVYDSNGEHWWPGRMIPGSKESDRWNQSAPFAAAGRDAFCVFDDKYNVGKPSLGIGVQEQIYDYGRAYAEDISFVEFLVINTSNEDIEDAYVGYHLYPFLPGGGLNDDYLVAYDSEYDQDDKPDVIYCYDPSETGDWGEFWANTIGGMIILETPLTTYTDDGEIDDMGVTDFHFFEAIGPNTDESQWPVICSDTLDADLAGPVSDYFHDTGPDNRIDNTDWIPDNREEGANWAFFVISGPIDLAAGDSTWFTIGFTAGANLDEFEENVATAQILAKKNFMGPGPPPPPTLSAVAGDTTVTLFWDALSEHAVDPTTGEKDFEGYKIYRLAKGPYGENDWGEEITNYRGEVVGYVPLFQCDKIDGITGFDLLNHNQYLGDDTGIHHTFVDTTVVNGVAYTYCITAYDSGDVEGGLPSFESSRSILSDERFVVAAVPGTEAVSLVPGSVLEDTLFITPEDTTFFVTVDVLDAGAVTGHDYEVTFSDFTVLYADSLYEQGFNLYDKDTGQYIIQNGPLTDVSGDNTPVGDGIRLSFFGRQPTGELEKRWLSPSTARDGAELHYWYGKRRFADYDYEFTIDTDSIVTLPAFQGYGDSTYQVPVHVRNIETGEDLTGYMKVVDQAGKYPRDSSYNALDYPAGSWDLDPGGACWNSIVDSLNFEQEADKLYGFDSDGRNLFTLYTIHPPDGVAPSDGDRFYLGTRKPFPRDAVFSFSTTKTYQKKVTQKMLDKIRVVPNPYICHAAWDIHKQMGKVVFTHLPAVCDIRIYTVAGDLVKTIEHRGTREPQPVAGPGRSFSYTRAGQGYEEWDLVNDAQLGVAYGLYIYVVSTSEGKKKIGKFAVIR